MKNQDWKLPLLNNYVEKFAKENPEKVAIIQHEDDKHVTYKKIQTLIDYFALRFLDLGIKKGDRIATQLVLFPEHIALAYACFKIGAIYAPLDLRLKKEEVKRSLDKIEPKIFMAHGKTPRIDFNEIVEYIRDNCKYIEQIVQIIPDAKPEDYVTGSLSVGDLMKKSKLIVLKLKNIFTKQLEKAYKQIDTDTSALIIFTTGTTGEPKPALISHENIINQNRILYEGVGGMLDGDKMLVNLPPSHVGCMTEMIMTTFFSGGTAVFLKIFDVELSLQAIQKHKITLLGQIPTQFRMLWAHPDYDKFDLSSLRFAIYAGSSVDVEFLNKLATMAPKFGTGLGMTETAGFTTFTPHGISVEEMSGQVGPYFEHLGKVSIRKSMNNDGSVGAECDDEEIGNICYHPPMVFKGYYNFPEATKKAISTEGILYSGDLGYFKDMGSYKALYLSGRDKFVIKQKGYQVFPDEVQAFIAEHSKVSQVDVVGIKHKLFDEGIFAFVKPKLGTTLTSEEIIEHCSKIASFKRPQFVEIWPEDKPFPITRSTKVDKMELKKQAEIIVEKLRKDGKWDA